jgi:hypothetical protein
MTAVYHPDPEINAEIAQTALEAEQADLAAGYPPRPWLCDCGASHSRGHFMTVGVHRCLGCGYVGPGGVMFDPEDPASQTSRAFRRTGRSS